MLLAPDEGQYDSTIDGRLTEAEIREREKVRQIEDRYTQSGLYRNDGTADLLWPIEYLSVSKKHLRIGRWDSS